MLPRKGLYLKFMMDMDYRSEGCYAYPRGKLKLVFLLLEVILTSVNKLAILEYLVMLKVKAAVSK